ncbi:hypothetical protein OROHE_013399 [Orobanche hederae]
MVVPIVIRRVTSRGTVFSVLGIVKGLVADRICKGVARAWGIAQEKGHLINPGAYSLQGRSGKVLQEVPSNAKGDPAKWFWVNGAWRSASSDPLPLEIQIPTEYRRPQGQQSFLGFCDCPRKDSDHLSGVSYFPATCSVQLIYFPCFPTPTPNFKMSGRPIGMLERMGAKAKKVVTKKTPRTPETERALAARTAPDVRPPRARSPDECVVVEPPPVERPSSSRSLTKRPSSDRPREEEEGQLVRPKKKKEVPPARSTAGPLIVGAPIAATPISERPPRPSDDFRRECEIMDAETSRGKPFFGCDPTKVERVLRSSPGCPPMVVDFVTGRAPQSNVDVPSCVTRAINNLPRALTTDLNEVSDRGGDDATQALFALILQAASMAATVARESELRPPVKKLQADLAESRKKYSEFCDRLVKMEKDSVDTAERARLQTEICRYCL